MSGRAVAELLAPEVILREVSQIFMPGTVLSDIFNWGLAARDPDAMTGNMIDYNLREGSFDVFNRTRRLATGSVPGSANTNIKPQKVGRTRFTIPRSAEQIPLTDEELSNRRQVGQAVTVVDSLGENYIMRQKRYLAEAVGNMIEFQTASLLRGSYTFTQVGDELRQSFSGGEDTIDYQISANHKNQLNGIIAASWATNSTDIPGQVTAVNRQCNTDCGLGIDHAVQNSATWQYVINNTKVATQAGTSNTPYMRNDKTGPGQWEIQLRAIPSVTWHIVDYTLEIWNGSAFADTALVANDQVTFFPEPSNSWVQYLNGGETVTEGPKGPRGWHNGFYAYGYESWNPSGWNIANVHNGIPALYVPNAIFNADVTP